MPEKHSTPDVWTCITADTRPGPWHAWERAAEHIRHTFEFGNWREREYMAQDCLAMAKLFKGQKKPPTRAIGLQFGWTLGIPEKNL